MHSSRMHTIRSSGRILWGGVPGPGGCAWFQWGVCTWSGGSTWSGWVYLVPGGVPGLGEGCLLPGGCTWSGGGTWSRGMGVSSWGVCSSGGVPGQLLPPPPCGQTDACKNITFATSLRTVKTKNTRLPLGMLSTRLL